MESKNTGCEVQIQPNKFFETTGSLTDYLSKELVFYYFSQQHRILSGCNFYYKLFYNVDISLNPSAYFWGMMVNEIIDNHRRFSLAKISIETDIDLCFVSKVWIGQTDQMPLDIGQKILTLHNKIRPDLHYQI